ncbi:MAG: hypothetical protein EBV03_10785 [Proteobacteria bacterium]|nr:hypothetical protein [Pseudomonadota bacterium]
MDPNLYTSLFLDSFTSAVFVMLQSDIYYPAMLAMGSFHVPTVSLLAFLGAMLGASINWMMGSLVATAKRQSALAQGKNDVSGTFGTIMKYAERYGIWLLLFSWISIFGGLVSLFAGVFGIRYWRALGVLALGRILYQIYMVYWF